jgi:hypothetical protein
LWFVVAGSELLISIKTGPDATKADTSMLGPLVGSIAVEDRR